MRNKNLIFKVKVEKKTLPFPLFFPVPYESPASFWL